MILQFDVAGFVVATLAEDLGAGGDVTSAAVIPAGAVLAAVMASRDAVTVAGLPLAAAFFRALDPDCRIETLVGEGRQRRRRDRPHAHHRQRPGAAGG